MKQVVNGWGKKIRLIRERPSQNNSNAKISEITEKQKASNIVDSTMDIPNTADRIFQIKDNHKQYTKTLLECQ